MENANNPNTTCNGGTSALDVNNKNSSNNLSNLKSELERHNKLNPNKITLDFLPIGDNDNDNDDNNNKSNGLLPKIWGPHMWKALHCITFGYPEEPTPFEKKNYKTFFEMLSFVLPCEACRESYKRTITTGSNKLTDNVFESRATLTLWLYNIHQSVNSKLCVNYNITFKDVTETYESFRVKCEPGHKNCVMPIEQRKISYCNEYKKEYPIIPYNVIKCFSQYAELRGIESFISQIDKMQYIIDNKDVYEDKWDERNKNCDELVKYMRQTGIYAVEQDGEFKGLPTITELLLFSYMASSMNINEIKKAAEIIGFDIKKTYKFGK
jgi:hypothetical protein